MDAIGRGRTWAADARVADAALVVACLVLTYFAVRAHYSAMPRPVIAAVGAAGSLAQWWRRSRPQLAAAAGAAAYALSGNPGPLLVGLYSGALYAPRRQVWALPIVGVAGFAGYSWIDAGHLAIKDVAWSILVAALVTAVGVYMSTRRALAESWRARAESTEAERRLRDERARAAERTRIAREMHDVLAHKVSLIALHAGALELTATGSSPRIQQGATLIRVTAREALQELRYVLGVLRTEVDPLVGAPLDGGEPFADLATLVKASTQAGQWVELHDRAGPLPATMARVVYRVAQEGLTNAHKHAPGAATTVAVDRDEDGTVRVSVHNTSTGSAPMDLPGSGSGLVGLAERIRLAGGTIHSGPTGAGGWQLRAVLPPIEHDADEQRPTEEP